MNTANGFRTEPRSFKLAFRDEAAVNIAEINDEILDSVSKYGERAVLGYTKKGRAVTFEELARNGLSADLPGDGREVVKILTFDFKDGKLFVLDRQSAVPLARLKLTVAYRALAAAPAAPSADKPLDPEDDDYTQDVFVKRKEA
jgi:hypothetical protein